MTEGVTTMTMTCPYREGGRDGVCVVYYIVHRLCRSLLGLIYFQLNGEHVAQEIAHR